ncbi:hypothetical protein Ccrd_014089 [Cynara cardunculus var. scolymus]|uniref:Uncharacterized protein n=1 Tax=Cynara cardunculus var. scolymus TaxID=59895 RepID=A0A118K4G4_CYNCS|nr:hypothetical protein Ccrd_014089 [Cynara cardunculus var. scolymus]
MDQFDDDDLDVFLDKDFDPLCATDGMSWIWMKAMVDPVSSLATGLNWWISWAFLI